MGGLRKQLPLAFWSFIVGGGALAAFPFVTAGFYSKDEILWQAFAGGHGGLFICGLVGAFLTSLYTFRLIFTVFFGEAKIQAHAGHGIAHWLPLSVLLVLSTLVGGLLIHPPLAQVLPAGPSPEDGPASSAKLSVELLSAAVALSGIGVAAWLFFGKPAFMDRLEKTALARKLEQLWFNAFGFDWLYDRLFVKPYLWAVRVNGRDWFDVIIGGIPLLLTGLNRLTSHSESGRLRWYAASMAFGAVLVIAAVAYL
jgi:NADH-quinone oxidoreductase subunit L